MCKSEDASQPPTHYIPEIHSCYFSEPKYPIQCSDANAEAACPENMVSFRVVWNKHNYDVTFNANDTVGNLKKHIETLTGQEICEN